MDDVTRARHALAGRLVVVTGASSGIGRATAEALAASGATFALLARRAELLEQVAVAVRAAGGAARTYPVDLRDARAARACAERILADLGVPDLVIANAGHSIARGVLDYVDRFDTIERSTAVNYLGAVALLLPFVREMAARGHGQVIGVSTVNARIPVPGWSPYVASKAAFDTWLRCVQPELRSRGVRTTIVAFPLVDTAMVEPVYGRRSRWAMPVDRAVVWVSRAIVTRRARIAPWWARPAELATALAPTLSARLLGVASARWAHRR
jgi:NAD(P)-dependent dehydrogenase (short-subunit alcohol dehydrogenase family)